MKSAAQVFYEHHISKASSTEEKMSVDEFSSLLGTKINPFHEYKKNKNHFSLLAVLIGLENLDYLKVWINHVGPLSEVSLPKGYAPLLHHSPLWKEDRLISSKPWEMLMEAGADPLKINKQGFTAFEHHLNLAYAHISIDIFPILGQPLFHQLFNQLPHESLRTRSSRLVRVHSNPEADSENLSWPEWAIEKRMQNSFCAQENIQNSMHVFDFFFSLADPKVEEIFNNMEYYFKNTLYMPGMQKKIVEYLLNQNMDINRVDGEGMNMGHACLMHTLYGMYGGVICPVEVLAFLSDHGLDFNHQNSAGWSVNDRLSANQWDNQAELDMVFAQQERKSLHEQTPAVQHSPKRMRL